MKKTNLIIAGILIALLFISSWYGVVSHNKMKSLKQEIIFLQNKTEAIVKKNGDLEYQLAIARGNVAVFKNVIDSFIITEKQLKKEIGRLGNLLSITEYKLSITTSGQTKYIIKTDTAYKDVPYYVFATIPIRDSLFRADITLLEDYIADYDFELYPITIRDVKYKDGKKTMMKLTTNNSRIQLSGITTFVMDEGKYNSIYAIGSISDRLGIGATLTTKNGFLFEYEYKFNTPINHNFTVGKLLFKF